MSSGFQCSYCGEWNPTEVDQFAGAQQQFVEDCQVCCQPNVVQVRFDQQLGDYVVSARRES